ncbi:MAG: hypothetical protein RLZZ127_1267 [Planctomycetota bacterium]|jgi:chromosome segregation ATPase
MHPRRFIDPLALTVLGAGAATAAATGLWLMAPLAVAGYGLLVWNGHDPEPPAPPPEAQLPPAQRAAEERIAALAARIGSAIAESDRRVQACFTEVPAQLQQVRAATRSLLAQQGRAEAFLAEQREEILVRTIAELETRIAAAGDAEARAPLERALATSREALADHRRIRANRDRIAAELTEVESVLRRTLGRIVSLDSAQGDFVGASADVQQALGDLAGQVAALDRALAPA